MRVLPGSVVVGFSLAFTAGCSRSGPPTSGEPPAPAAVSPTASGKKPKFESELVYTHTLNGGTGSSHHTSTRHDDGKTYSAVENWSSSVKGGGPITLDCEVVFVAHRDGKDVYKIKHTVGKANGSETKTSEAGYDGKRTVLVEDQYCTLVLQPPSK